MKFNITFQRVFTVDIEAENIEHAQAIAQKIVATCPEGSRLVSIEEQPLDEQVN